MISEKAIKAVFENSLKLKSNESCLVITDRVKESLARPFYKYAKNICSNCNIEVMDTLQGHGQEPLEYIANLMLQYDVQLLITDKSLTHTKARRNATEKGARIASMPMLTEDIANRCLDVDYNQLRESSIKLARQLKKATNVRITTALGTDITLEIGNKPIYDNNGGVFNIKGAFGNLPEGEVEFSPINARGVYVVDASFPMFGKLKSTLTFIVENGFVTEISGEKSEELKSNLDKIGRNTYLVAELGIGLNPKAKVIGNVLEDEKVLGTCHIAIGNNISYGGGNDVPIHLDGVITKPTIYLDNKIVMKDGLSDF